MSKSNVKKDAERGCRFAQCVLGIMYQHGDGLQQSDVQAAFWYQKAAEQGHAGAQVFLGNSFRRGKGVQQDYKEAAKWFHAAADQGNANAQFLLGLAYRYGEGVKQDFQETEKWWRLAVHHGYAANAPQGLLDMLPKSTSEDEGQMLREYERTRIAAEGGNASMQAYLGCMFDTGMMPRNYTEAAK